MTDEQRIERIGEILDNFTYKGTSGHNKIMWRRHTRREIATAINAALEVDFNKAIKEYERLSCMDLNDEEDFKMQCTPQETLLETTYKTEFVEYPENQYELDRCKVREFIKAISKDVITVTAKG